MGGSEGQEEWRLTAGCRDCRSRSPADCRPGNSSPTESHRLEKALNYSGPFPNQSDRRLITSGGCDLTAPGGSLTHHSETQVLGERLKIAVAVQQVIPALDASRRNHRIDGLANSE